MRPEHEGFELMQALLRTAAVLRGELERALAKTEVTTEQWVLLEALLARDGRMQRELAEHAGKDRSTITRLVDALAERGLVERRADPDDARRTRTWLTRRGFAAAQAAHAAAGSVVVGSLGQLRDHEVTATTRAFNVVLDAWKWG